MCADIDVWDGLSYGRTVRIGRQREWLQLPFRAVPCETGVRGSRGQFLLLNIVLQRQKGDDRNMWRNFSLNNAKQLVLGQSLPLRQYNFGAFAFTVFLRVLRYERISEGVWSTPWFVSLSRVHTYRYIQLFIVSNLYPLVLPLFP